MTAKTVGDYEITFPNDVVFTFKALITSVKPGGADAQSPELLELEVTFQPSGEMTIAVDKMFLLFSKYPQNEQFEANVKEF